MELKTILQILRMNEDRLAEYVLEAAPSLDLNLFDRIIRSWREHPTYIPAPSNVATALINFIIDNHDKAGFHITTTAVPVTPDNYRVIEWETEEFGRYCATFTLQDAEFINDALADIMKKTGNDNTFTLNLTFKIRFNLLHTFIYSKGCLASIQRMFHQTTCYIQMMTSRCRSLEKSKFLQVLDDIIHSWTFGRFE